MKNEIIFPKLMPLDIIIKGLRPTLDDEHEKKRLREKDEEWQGKVMRIIRKRK